MPKTKFQHVIFTFLMALFMVFSMICYNIAIAKNGMSNTIFLIAFQELALMFPIAFLFEFFFFLIIATMLAFRIVSPTDRPFLIQTTMSIMIVWLMCPLMSLTATLLFQHPGAEIFSIWLQTTIRNFPMALLWQLFVAGPLVRFIFRGIFPNKKSSVTI